MHLGVKNWGTLSSQLPKEHIPRSGTCHLGKPIAFLGGRIPTEHWHSYSKTSRQKFQQPANIDQNWISTMRFWIRSIQPSLSFRYRDNYASPMTRMMICGLGLIRHQSRPNPSRTQAAFGSHKQNPTRFGAICGILCIKSMTAALGVQQLKWKTDLSLTVTSSHCPIITQQSPFNVCPQRPSDHKRSRNLS